MQKDTIVIIAAAGIGLFLISRMVKPRAPGAPPSGGTAASLNNYGNAPVTEISNSALPGQNGWGWQYFSDGTAISPTGQYYLNGQLVWSPGAGNMGLSV